MLPNESTSWAVAQLINVAAHRKTKVPLYASAAVQFFQYRTASKMTMSKADSCSSLKLPCVLFVDVSAFAIWCYGFVALP